MGKLEVLKVSYQKSKLIKRIAVENDKYNWNEAESLMKELWEILQKFSSMLFVIAKHEYTFEKFKADSERLWNNGYGWQEGEYIPLSILCFAPPLDFYLSNLEEYDANDEYDRLVYETFRVLKSM